MTPTTGREIIIYILENGLENEEIFKDGILVGCLTIEETAIKFNVGIATVKTWVHENMIKSFFINGNIVVPANAIPRID